MRSGIGRSALRGPLRLALGAFALAGAASAHPDDPKILDIQQPYEGPGYHRGQDPTASQGFQSSRVALEAWLPLGTLFSGSVSGNDCWGYVSPTGREYALIGVSHGTSVVEISDPGNPVVIAALPGPVNLWHDIKVYRDFAYVVSEGGQGIRIIDLREVDQGIVTQTSRFGGASHNVALNPDSGRLYRVGGAAWGTYIYSLDDPASPVRIGEWTDTYIHDAQVVSYTDGAFAGREVMFACVGSQGMRILDVTDPQAVTVISEFHYGEAYAHQCWLSPDRRYLYVGDELDESGGAQTRTYVFDVSDLTRPRSEGRFTNGSTATDHNLYTRGTLIFEANYRTGLRIFDATDPVEPVEIGYFDTYPADDDNNFNGLWSNFPYFPSGTIIGSDRERGLFVWSLRDYPLSIALPEGRLPEFAEPGTALVAEVVRNVPSATPAGPPVLHYDVGDGFIALPMSPRADGRYEAQLPADLCNAEVSYYLAIDSTDDTTATSPVGAPGSVYTTYVAGRSVVTLQDQAESPLGWIVNADGDDTATSGAWAHGDPLGSPAEPSDDVSATGVNCWHTGLAQPGASPNDHDVDGGRTTLVSPSLDLRGLHEPAVAYWRWFHNGGGGLAGTADDRFTVQISNDDGASWTLFERIRPDDPAAGGGWLRHVGRVNAVLPGSEAVRLRFIAADREAGSRVEAAIDDLQVLDLLCTPCAEDLDGDGMVGLYELGQVLAHFGQSAAPWSGDFNGDQRVDLTDLALVLQGFGTGCP